MRIHPTSGAIHVGLSGAAMLALGVATRTGAICAFGGAMILAVAMGRALALLSVTRLRAAGFEMRWPTQLIRARRLAPFEVQVELRNRSGESCRAEGLRAVASSMLRVTVTPDVVDLPPNSRTFLQLQIQGARVGRWGVHALALRVRAIRGGGVDPYEVPLVFANPLGVEVLPRALGRVIDSPHGGRARRGADAGRRAHGAGDGDELRELREHVSGDSFKRIAWRASAKRGRLLVREFNQDRRDIVWLVVGASVELWAGVPGSAPLDAIVDDVSAVAARHLLRGDRVGLAIVASRPRSWLPPDGGPAQALKIARALAGAANCLDSDQSGLDEDEIAARVAEHLQPLDQARSRELTPGDLDSLLTRAEIVRAKAPFAPRLPFAPTARERRLRHYLASFGIEGAPLGDGEAARTAATLAATLDQLGRERTRPSVVQVWAPACDFSAALRSAMQRLRRQRTDLRWALARSVEPHDDGPCNSVQQAVDRAITSRQRTSDLRGTATLRALGVRVLSYSPTSGETP